MKRIFALITFFYLSCMKNRNYLYLYLCLAACALSVLLLPSCTKNLAGSVTSAYVAGPHDAIDTPLIKAYLASHTTLDSVKLTNVKKSDSTQLRYMIVLPARGDSSHNPQPKQDSGVVFNYSIRIMANNKAGRVIDSVGAPGYTVSPLNQTIRGLTEGLQYITRGERILLFMPSSLAFRDNPTDVTYNLLTGGQRTTTVPPNSVLIFDVTLTRVTKLH